MTTAVPLPYQATGRVSDVCERETAFWQEDFESNTAQESRCGIQCTSKSAMVRLNRLIVEQACKFQALALPPAEIIVRWRILYECQDGSTGSFAR